MPRFVQGLGALAVALALASSGCLTVDAPPRSGEAAGAIDLRITDWSGLDAEADAVPRRPRLSLLAPAPWKDDVVDSGAVVLLRGEVGDAWLDDLERAPLRKEHAALAVDSEVVLDGDTVSIAPRTPLDADATYSLAIGAWAVDARELPDSLSLPAVFLLRTADNADADAGAAVVGSWPADGSSGVGADLAEAVVYLDGDVENAPTSIWLEGPDGLAVPADTRVETCSVGLEARTATRCVSIVPHGGLAARATYVLRIGAGAHDARGAPVGPWQASFSTSTSVDRQRPTLVPLPCDIDEATLPWGCALASESGIALRVRSDEPARFQLDADGTRVERVSPRGDGRFAIVDLSPDTPVALELTVRDTAGNETSDTHEIRTTPPLATLAITEVRANPRGAEPEQELVELWNYGAVPIDLLGFSLADRPDAQGTPLSASAVVPPGGRALLVADGFDARDPLDVAPPPGARLVRVGPSLAEAGLSNGGEPLFLRDPSGRRISAAPASPRPRSGVCSVRVTDDPRAGEDGSFGYAPDDGCSPGR